MPRSGGGVIQFEEAVVAVGAQAFHAGQGIDDGGGGRFSARGVIAARRLGISGVVGWIALIVSERLFSVSFQIWR